VLVRLIADINVIKVRYSLKFKRSLPQVNLNLIKTKWRSQINRLAHQNLYISHCRETILLVDKSIGSSSENNVGNELVLFVNTRVHPNWNSYCKVIIRKLRSVCFICHDYIKAYDRVLSILGSLKK